MDVMIDIETLGRDHDAHIISIGAVKFNRHGCHDEYYAVMGGAMYLNGTITPETVEWWGEQSLLAINELTRRDVVTLKEALLGLIEFACNLDQPRIWANPPSFDLTKLRNAFYRTGLTTPWEWWQEMDSRTIRLALGVPKNQGQIEHHALEDAKSQAQVLNDCLRMIEHR